MTPEAQVRSTRAWENVGFESVDTIRGSAAMPLWGPLAAVVTPDSPLQNLSRIALPGATRQIVIQGDYVFGTADTSVFVWRMTRRI